MKTSAGLWKPGESIAAAPATYLRSYATTLLARRPCSYSLQLQLQRGRTAHCFAWNANAAAHFLSRPSSLKALHWELQDCYQSQMRLSRLWNGLRYPRSHAASPPTPPQPPLFATVPRVLCLAGAWTVPKVIQTAEKTFQSHLAEQRTRAASIAACFSSELRL